MRGALLAARQQAVAGRALPRQQGGHEVDRVRRLVLPLGHDAEALECVDQRLELAAVEVLDVPHCHQLLLRDVGVASGRLDLREDLVVVKVLLFQHTALAQPVLDGVLAELPCDNGCEDLHQPEGVDDHPLVLAVVLVREVDEEALVVQPAADPLDLAGGDRGGGAELLELLPLHHLLAVCLCLEHLLEEVDVRVGDTAPAAAHGALQQHVDQLVDAQRADAGVDAPVAVLAAANDAHCRRSAGLPLLQKVSQLARDGLEVHVRGVLTESAHNVDGGAGRDSLDAVEPVFHCLESARLEVLHLEEDDVLGMVRQEVLLHVLVGLRPCKVPQRQSDALLFALHSGLHPHLLHVDAQGVARVLQHAVEQQLVLASDLLDQCRLTNARATEEGHTAPREGLGAVVVEIRQELGEKRRAALEADWNPRERVASHVEVAGCFGADQLRALDDATGEVLEAVVLQVEILQSSEAFEHVRERLEVVVREVEVLQCAQVAHLHRESLELVVGEVESLQTSEQTNLIGQHSQRRLGEVQLAERVTELHHERREALRAAVVELQLSKRAAAALKIAQTRHEGHVREAVVAHAQLAECRHARECVGNGANLIV
mmetsp:Transcript_14784/g.57993  ORF Transcript_14784/g.57993 Transcript_14784/m.57993 type:complete len:602 (-) Transcript_14784:662-2467(-)